MPDPTGMQTMSPAMGQMRAYPAYLFGKIERTLGKRILEIGVGHGTYTEMLLDQSCHVRATDIDPACVQAAQQRFQSDPNFSTGLLDLTDRESVRQHADFQADSIVCLNVLEHIENDESALRFLRESTAAASRLALIVPAHQFLYGKMDAEAGHYRRYSRHRLATTMQNAGWRVEQCRYINFVGMLGWGYHNRLRKDAGLVDRSVNDQMRRADAWLPRFAKITDRPLGHVAGLSVLASGQSE